MEQLILKKEKELQHVNYLIEHGGDFLTLYEKKKVLTDEIRSLKLQLQCDNANISRNTSE